MESKKAIIWVFLLLATIFILPSAIAAVFLTSPESSSLQAGTIVLGANVTGSNENFTCIFYAGSSLTANTTWTQLGVATNNTAGGGTQNRTNITYSTLGIEDANNYQFNVTCTNNTASSFGNLGTQVNSSIIIDNTIPQVASSISPTGTQRNNNTLIFSGTVTGVNTTSCTLFFVGQNPGQSSYSMSHSGNSCTLTRNNVPESTYRYYIRSSDESNTTDSTYQTVTLDLTTSAGTAASYVSQGKAKSTGGASFSIIGDTLNGSILGIPLWIVIVIVIIIITVVMRRK